MHIEVGYSMRGKSHKITFSTLDRNAWLKKTEIAAFMVADGKNQTHNLVNAITMGLGLDVQVDHDAEKGITCWSVVSRDNVRDLTEDFVLVLEVCR